MTMQRCDNAEQEGTLLFAHKDDLHSSTSSHSFIVLMSRCSAQFAGIHESSSYLSSACHSHCFQYPLAFSLLFWL